MTAALPPAVVFSPAGHPAVAVEVEVARSEPERALGLMYRRELAADRGMLFLFPRSEVQHFWMKNTYVSLDMIFIGSDLRVVGVVENTTPLTTTPYSVGLPSQYVVEVNAGWARRHGITPGTAVRFERVEAAH